MHVVFTEVALAICCRRQAMVGRWGDAAPAVELALCTLKASRDMRRFLSLPNVTQEDDVMTFAAPAAAVQLRLVENEGYDGEVYVDVLSVAVVQPSRR